MNEDTILHRQIHPNWVQDLRPTSQAFRPSPKDGDLLSVYDGDKISAEDAWRHYTQALERDSFGVCAVTVGECGSVSLPATTDPKFFAEHAVIDFTGVGRKDAVRRAKILARHAITRGWQYQAETDE